MRRIGGGGSHRSGRRAGLIAAVVVLVLLAGGLTVWRWPVDHDVASTASGIDHDEAGATPAAAGPSPSVDRRPVSTAPMPDPARLAAALAGPLRDPGFAGPAQLEVADLDTGRVLFERDAGTPSAPASTAKLLTSLALLHRFGPDHRLDTRAYLSGRTLYLVGGGDPTLSPTDSATVLLAHGPFGHPASLADLARQVRKAGVTSVDRVLGDAGLSTGPALAEGWQPYFLQSQIAPVSALTVAERRTATPSLAATDAMRSALTGVGVHVSASGLGHLPAGARLVGSVSSPPLSALIEEMLVNSDNDMAETLGRVLAVATGRPGTFVGAASAVLDGVGQLGLPTAGVRLDDASGLSQEDRVPPALLVDVLESATDPAHPEFASIVAGLPVAGRTGTLAYRYHSAATRAGAGVVHAKSGRLLGMNALAGLVRTAQGRQLVFALRAKTADVDGGEQAIDRVATTLALCGCR